MHSLMHHASFLLHHIIYQILEGNLTTDQTRTANPFMLWFKKSQDRSGWLDHHHLCHSLNIFDQYNRIGKTFKNCSLKHNVVDTKYIKKKNKKLFFSAPRATSLHTNKQQTFLFLCARKHCMTFFGAFMMRSKPYNFPLHDRLQNNVKRVKIFPLSTPSTYLSLRSKS